MIRHVVTQLRVSFLGTPSMTPWERTALVSFWVFVGILSAILFPCWRQP